MNNAIIWIILGIISIIFGVLSRIAAYKKNNIIFWLFEIWRDSACYFVAAIIGYFFIDVRWSYIYKSGNLSVNDFILVIIFLFAVLGWWPYIIKNISEGIEKIVTKLIGKS